MHYFKLVEGFKSSDDLSELYTYSDEDFPDGVFIEIGPVFLVVTDFLEQVSIVGVLHHNAGIK